MPKDLICAKNDKEAIKAPAVPPKWEDSMLEEIFERTKKGDKFPRLLEIAAENDMDTIVSTADIPDLQKEIIAFMKQDVSPKTKEALMQLGKIAEVAVKEQKSLYFLV